ncbi:MAG: hypothetical protein ABGW98_21815 [Myxococcales bacterium]
MRNARAANTIEVRVNEFPLAVRRVRERRIVVPDHWAAKRSHQTLAVRRPVKKKLLTTSNPSPISGTNSHRKWGEKAIQFVRCPHADHTHYANESSSP